MDTLSDGVVCCPTGRIALQRGAVPQAVTLAARGAIELKLGLGGRVQSFKGNEPGGTGTWFLRVASLIGIVAAFAGIGFFVRRGESAPANALVFVAVASAILFAWSWRGAFLTPFEWAKRYVGGVEGDHRHEWYAFKGQRVRIFLDETGQPWFALKEIALILALAVDDATFRHYTSKEIGIPSTASERCLSERGLRRLIKYSKHRDAGALGLWLEREVLRVLHNRKERERSANS